MRCQKHILLLCLIFGFCCFVLSHELPKQGHEHYSFEVLRGEVNGDSLMPDDVDRLLSKLHFWNCSDSSLKNDYRKCLSSSDLYNFAGWSSSKPLNSTEFAQISPFIVYCLLPAPEKNPGRCQFSPKNHSELFTSFARNYSHSQPGEPANITLHALDHIFEGINKTIGQFLTRNKCFSAESIFEEIEEQEEGHHEEGEHHGEEGEHHEEEHHHEEEEKALHQEDFEKACASIVLHLVQEFCIEEAHGHNETKSSLPPKEFFIKDLFKKKTHLSEADLEEIMEVLGIGKAEDDHHDHDHRRRRSAVSASLTQQGSGAAHHVHRRAAHDHDHDHDHPETNSASGSVSYAQDELSE